MYFPLILPLLFSLPATIFAATLPPQLEHTLLTERQTPSNACATGVHVIAGSGNGSGAPNTYELLRTLVTNITSLIPGSNNFLLGPFNKSLPFPVYTGLFEQQLRQYLEDYSSACPTTEIVLVGYSAGGVATMNGLCGATVVPPWNRTYATWKDYPIIASVVYGEELQVAGKPYDVGTCTNNAPKGHRSVGACRAFFPHMQSYCDSGDPQCCAGGTNQSEHFSYPELYDVKAANFVYSQWQTFKRAKKSKDSPTYINRDF